MNETTINLITALAIASVIGLMAVLKESRIRALIYTLPIPISIALIATGGVVSSLNLVGLIFVGFFIWGVYYLYEHKNWNILVADIILAILYVIFAYIFTQNISLPYVVSAVAFLFLWFVLVLFVRNHHVVARPRTQNKLPAWAKTLIVFGMAYVLLALKGHIAGFVVTFPFSGVFAVYEGRDMLRVLGTIIIRNSIAIWAFFTSIHLISGYLGEWASLLLGWVVFGIVLILVTKLVPLGGVGKTSPN